MIPPVHPKLIAAIDGLVASFRTSGAPTFPTGMDPADFVRCLEHTLTHADLVDAYLAHLDATLGLATPEGVLPGEVETDRFVNEGLGWMATDRLALLAIDRGAVVALHEWVLDEWSDYWWERAVDRSRHAGTWVEPAERLAALRTRLGRAPADDGPRPTPSAADTRSAVSLHPADTEFPLAFDGSGPPTPVVPTGEPGLPVPIAQANWTIGDPEPLTVQLSQADGRWVAQIDQLPIVLGFEVSGCLADAAGVVVRGAVQGAAMVFELPPRFVPTHLLFDYRAPFAAVVFAVALNGTAVPPEVFIRLRTACNLGSIPRRQGDGNPQ